MPAPNADPNAHAHADADADDGRRTASERSAWYAYAIVRVVPRVERGECVNAGVVLFSPTRRYLEARIALDPRRVQALDPRADLAAIARHLEAFRAVAAGEPHAGPIAALSPSERFHWLTAPRSTAIQTSPVHTGCCDDPARALGALLEALVLDPG